MLGGIVDKMEKQNSYRDDLKCPCPNQRMVWDNRRIKNQTKVQTLYVQVGHLKNVHNIQANGGNHGG